MKLKLLKILIILMMTIPLVSCSNFTELEERYMVLGLAVDYEKGLYCMTAEVMNIEDSKVGKIVSKNYVGYGKSLFEAMRNTIKTSGKRMFWGHNKLLIISKNLASDQKKVYYIMDFIRRDQEIRSDSKIIISREKTAKEILRYKPKGTSLNSISIIEILKNSKSEPQYPDVELWDFSIDFFTPGIEPIAPAIRLVKENGEKRLEMCGTAVFKDYKLLGFLDNKKSMNLIFVRDLDSNGLLTLSQKTTKLKTDLDLEIFNSSTTIKPKLNNGTVMIEIKVKPEFGLAAKDSDLDIGNEEIQNQLKKVADHYLESRIKETIQFVQQKYKSDIFGFGHKINTSLPSEWEKIKTNWNQQFSNLDFVVKVESTLKVSGLLSKP